MSATWRRVLHLIRVKHGSGSALIFSPFPLRRFRSHPEDAFRTFHWWFWAHEDALFRHPPRLLHLRIRQARWREEEPTGSAEQDNNHRSETSAQHYRASKQQQIGIETTFVIEATSFSTRRRHSWRAGAILDSLSSFWNFNSEDPWNILRTNRQSVDLKTATFIDSGIVSNAYLFIHCAFIDSLRFIHAFIHAFIWHFYMHLYCHLRTHSYMHSRTHFYMHS